MKELISESSSWFWLARASAQGAVLVGLVLLLQWMFQKRLPARWRHALWWLVVIRLVLPLTPASPLSAFNWLRVGTSHVTYQSEHQIAAVTEDASRMTHGARPSERFVPFVVASSPTEAYPAIDLNARQGRQSLPPTADFTLRGWIAAGWLGGVVLLAVWMIIRQVRLYRRLRTGNEVVSPVVLALLEECRQVMGVPGSLRLVETRYVGSPALFGLLTPRILLPEGMLGTLNAKEMRHVFLHELAHLRRRDILMNWIVAIVQVIHWFNPVVWYGLMRMRADGELACDELALQRSNDGENQAYGRTLLKLLETVPANGSVPGVVGILEDRRDLARRIGMIALFGKVTRWPALAAVLLILLGVIGLTDAQTVKPAEAKVAEATPAEGKPAVRTPLRGTVVGESGQPVSGARVIMKIASMRQQEVAVTDTGGAFAFTNKNVAAESIVVFARGYVPALLQAGTDGVTNNLVIKLHAGVAYKGRVIDENLQPLRGVTVVGRKLGSRDGTVDWKGETDSEGRFSWDSAPEGGAILTLVKEGFPTNELKFPDGLRMLVARMEGLQQITGTVVDADTRKPIADFHVFLGWHRMMAGEKCYGWNSFRMVRGQNGKYEAEPDPAVSSIKVEAAGYLPQVLDLVEEQYFGHQINFELKAGRGPRGIVVSPDGTPVAGAQVALVTSDRIISLLDDTVVPGDKDSYSVVETDKQGRFELLPEALAESVIAVNSDGFAEMSIKSGEQEYQIVLQKWGRIEGVLLNHKTAMAGERVEVAPGMPRPQGLGFGYKGSRVQTDEMGRFVFEHVPPGDRVVFHAVETQPHWWKSEFPKMVTIQSGKTSHCQIGGFGRQVIGNALLRTNVAGAEWELSDGHQLVTKAMRPPADVKTHTDYLAWRTRPEVKKANAVFSAYPIKLAENGAFSIDDVEPGTYVLRIFFRRTTGGTFIAEGHREVVVTESPVGLAEVALNLGVFEVSPDPSFRGEY